MIELADGNTGQNAEIVFDDSLQGHAYLRQHRLLRYAYSAWSRLVKKR